MRVKFLHKVWYDCVESDIDECTEKLEKGGFHIEDIKITESGSPNIFNVSILYKTKSQMREETIDEVLE